MYVVKLTSTIPANAEDSEAFSVREFGGASIYATKEKKEAIKYAEKFYEYIRDDAKSEDIQNLLYNNFYDAHDIYVNICIEYVPDFICVNIGFHLCALDRSILHKYSCIPLEIREDNECIDGEHTYRHIIEWLDPIGKKISVRVTERCKEERNE